MLAKSSMCWNEFEDVDFCNTILRNSDLRGSRFLDCEFCDPDLRGSDLRHSEFIKCHFDDAKMKGTIMTRDQADKADLDEKQMSVIDWRDDAGPNRMADKARQNNMWAHRASGGNASSKNGQLPEQFG